MRTAIVWLTLSLSLPALAGPVQVRGGQFVGPDGRPIILRGLNVGQACKQPPHLPWQTAADLARIREWGGNCVRFLIIWAAVEPTPGTYDDAYLAAVRERLEWARAAGLYVVLDMHQDLYGEKHGGDGAPRWACLDNGTAYDVKPGQYWAAGYFQPATMAAFESFWSNAPGPGGMGVQDHFVAVWRHVVQKLGDQPAVIGYDLLNEPFYGNPLAYPEAIGVLLRLQALLPGGPNPMDLFTGEGAGATLHLRQDPDRLFAAVDLGDPIYQRFERERLMPLYRRLVPDLRQITPDAIFFLEPHIWASAGANSALERPEGDNDLQLAYAPHFYDPGCSPDTGYDGNPERARRAFVRMAQVAARLGGPVFLGEWGAAESPAATAANYVRDEASLLRQMGFSSCYWEYGPDLAQRPEFPGVRAVLSGAR